MKFTIKIGPKNIAPNDALAIANQVSGLVAASLHAKEPINLTMETPLGTVSIESE